MLTGLLQLLRQDLLAGQAGDVHLEVSDSQPLEVHHPAGLVRAVHQGLRSVSRVTTCRTAALKPWLLRRAWGWFLVRCGSLAPPNGFLL